MRHKQANKKLKVKSCYWDSPMGECSDCHRQNIRHYTLHKYYIDHSFYISITASRPPSEEYEQSDIN
jgi:hypothetical protein